MADVMRKNMDIDKILKKYGEIVFRKSNRKAFDTSTKWACQIVVDAGVYAFVENDKLVYVGVK